MDAEDFATDWEGASKEMMTGMKAWRKEHPHATLTEMEDELDRRMNQLRGEMITDMAQASALTDIQAIPEEERPKCPECGTPLGPRGQHARSLTTSGDAQITIERSYAVCPQCKAGFFPPG